MALGRNKKCVMKNATTSSTVAATASQKVMPHNEFIHRIRKSLYFGADSRTEDIKVSRPLAEYASELFSEPYKGHSLKRLYFGELPPLCIHATPCSLIMALIYLDRLSVTDPLYVRRITPQELFIVSMMISTKFYAGHDEEIYLSDWAEDGEITEKRLKHLELEFLCAIDWNIYISNEQFFTKLSSVEKTVAYREGLRRGWLTYTELAQWLPSFEIAKFMIQNLAVMVVGYAASVMTIAGAFFLASHIPGNALHRKTMEGFRASSLTDTAVMTNETMPLASQDVEASPAPSVNATQSVVISADQNDSCNTLDIDAELLKWECQYREESEREMLRLRQNEITTDLRRSLDTIPGWGQQVKVNGRMAGLFKADTQHNWLALKSEYSDELEKELNRRNLYENVLQDSGQSPHHRDTFADCVINYGNCSMFDFWHLLSDVPHQSFVRVPLMWLKMI